MQQLKVGDIFKSPDLAILHYSTEEWWDENEERWKMRNLPDMYYSKHVGKAAKTSYVSHYGRNGEEHYATHNYSAYDSTRANRRFRVTAAVMTGGSTNHKDPWPDALHITAVGIDMPEEIVHFTIDTNCYNTTINNYETVDKDEKAVIEHEERKELYKKLKKEFEG